MVYSTLADKAMLAHKLQSSLENTSAQLDIEKASFLAKDNRIKSLEDIIIELGHDPKDAKGIRALTKKRKRTLLPSENSSKCLLLCTHKQQMLCTRSLKRT